MKIIVVLPGIPDDQARLQTFAAERHRVCQAKVKIHFRAYQHVVRQAKVQLDRRVTTAIGQLR